MASISLNNDVVTEILLRLPIRSLLRFKVVRKFWRDVIDSPYFRRLHVQKQANNNNNDDHDKILVIVQLNYLQYELRELSIILPDNGIYDFPALRDFFNDQQNTVRVRVVGTANGLICMHRKELDVGPIAVCNPSLGEIRNLPEYSPPFSFFCCHCFLDRNVGIGFDNVAQDYKVVQLLSCFVHSRAHASVYSRATNSWRDLAENILDDLYVKNYIKSSCTNGTFAHWRATRVVGENHEKIILSFDMENEVFRTLEIPSNIVGFLTPNIFATEESFVLFTYNSDPDQISIFEALFEGNKICWNFVAKLREVDGVAPTPKALSWRSDCVILDPFEYQKREKRELCIYDFRAEEMVGRLPIEMAANSNDKFNNFKVFQYEGSFISP